MRSPLIFLFSCFFLLFTSTLTARIIHVPADSTTIQGGINGAVDGDTVLVADATYTGDGNRDIDFLGKAIVVMSENGPDNCIIDCDGDSASFHRGFHFRSGEDSCSVVQGFTVRHGYASGDWPMTYGGAIFCQNSSSPVIRGNLITRNIALDGGGVACWNSSPTLLNNTIARNGARFHGGGILCLESAPRIFNNTIRQNSAVFFGGGLSCVRASPAIRNNSVSGNGANGGGGLSLWSSAPSMSNNTIVDNLANSLGGGIFCLESDLQTVTSAILWDNHAPTGKEICLAQDSMLDISYSDLEGAQGSVYVEPGSILYWGDGMLDADPRFIPFQGFDYLLRRGSPCIDAGDPAEEDGLFWPYWYNNGPRSDMGAYGGPGNVGWLLGSQRGR
jgi:hypothetical protein